MLVTRVGRKLYRIASYTSGERLYGSDHMGVINWDPAGGY